MGKREYDAKVFAIPGKPTEKHGSETNFIYLMINVRVRFG